MNIIFSNKNEQEIDIITKVMTKNKPRIICYVDIHSNNSHYIISKTTIDKSVIDLRVELEKRIKFSNLLSSNMLYNNIQQVLESITRYEVEYVLKKYNFYVVIRQKIINTLVDIDDIGPLMIIPNEVYSDYDLCSNHFINSNKNAIIKSQNNIYYRSKWIFILRSLTRILLTLVVILYFQISSFWTNVLVSMIVITISDFVLPNKDSFYRYITSIRTRDNIKKIFKKEG